MKIIRLKTNRIVNPLGFELEAPILSWTVTKANGRTQKWAKIIVAEDEALINIVFDSGNDESASSICYPLNIVLKPRTRYYWQVTVCTDMDEIAKSETTWFETSKINEPFVGEYIKPELPYDVCPYMRKSFTINGKIKRARAYFTGLGIYELYINGKKAGDEYLAPGCTAYDKWIQYQTYDVTDYINEGENVIGAILGNGWAKGKFGFDGQLASYENNSKGSPSDIFTSEYMLLGDLIIETDIETITIATDNTWQCAASPITFSSIYDGERYDATKEIVEWSEPSSNSYPWQGTDYSIVDGKLTARLSLPIKKMHEFKPTLIKTPKNELVLDVGQVISGWIEFKAMLPKGTNIRLSYGELLQDGCFYRDNMRSALCEYRYISNGEKTLARPITTFYGFRYAMLEGFTQEINVDDFTAWAIYSDMETTGNIVTANEKVNRLFENCLWSQRDNFVDVPTDCPQRDERMGWTGDAQVFCPTANFNMDCLAFYTKYGNDLYIDQKMFNGRVTHVTPLIAKGADSMLVKDGGSCGWADAATVVPWMTYVFSGDKTILQKQFASMKDWADWIHRHDIEHGNTGLWLETTMHFGDWLALDGAKSGFDPEAVIGGTDNTFLCSAYYYYSTILVAKAASVLGNKSLEIEYLARAEKILAAIRKEFYTPGGRCAAATQTGQAISLHFGLAPEEYRGKITEQLRRLLKDNDMHLKTGFLGTPILCRALSDNNANEDAYTLFLQEDLPSWLYEVNMGATTIWERWNSVLPNGKISGTSMNSMNHYSYGAVIEWVYRNVCGINPSESAPGFKEFTLAPQPDKRLGSITAKISTAAGVIESAWKYIGDKVEYSFTVPFNTRAYLMISAENLQNGTINNEILNIEDGIVNMELMAGTYIIN